MHTRSKQVYEALRIAAERIGRNNYRKGLEQHIKAGKSPQTYQYVPTIEHRTIVLAMGDLSLSDDEVMALLHDYDVMQQRLGE